MIKRIKIPNKNWDIDETIPRYTQIKDVKAILYLIQFCEGNILEIGCNTGITTNEFCRFYPMKKIYAVDYMDSNKTMVKEQKRETPTTIGSLVNNRKNCILINKKSQDLNMYDLEDVGFIFIDGDHSYEAVKEDTKKSIEYIFKRGKGIICWHDYETKSSWIGVTRLLNELSLRFSIKHFDETFIAYTIVSKLF
jgi:SAM-dependent methyltransferase